MATFSYVIRLPDGRVQRGSESAANAKDVAAGLRGRGAAIVDIRLLADDAQSAGTIFSGLSPSRWLPPRSQDVETGLLQLSLLLRSGVTLLTGLGNVAEQALRASVERIWRTTGRRVQQGSSLADAVQVHRSFPPLVVQLIRIGEQTGTLEAVLARAAEIMERRRQLRQMLLTAMLYPLFVVIAAFGVAAFMVVGVIPKLERFLQQLGRRLPPLTQSLLDLSFYIRTYWLEGLVALVLVLVSAGMIYSTTSGRYWIDRYALRLPLVGGLLRLSGAALAARSLSILLESGVTLLEALRAVETVPANHFQRAVLARTRDDVIQGRSLATGLREPHAFAPMLAAMAAVGESSGSLDEVLSETARFHETQLEAAIRRFSALIEPAIVIVVGAVVGYVYIAFFLALFSIAGPANFSR